MKVKKDGSLPSLIGVLSVPIGIDWRPIVKNHWPNLTPLKTGLGVAMRPSGPPP